jgi:hypothetical protein
VVIVRRGPKSFWEQTAFVPVSLALVDEPKQRIAVARSGHRLLLARHKPCSWRA